MNTKMIYRIMLGAALVLLAAVSAWQMILPRAAPADAPNTRFSAGRAMADLQTVASEPHMAGSRAQELVRAYIVEQVESLGLQPVIETSGRIANILVRLPGTDSSGTVLVSGHYDSQPPSPGAGDNGVSVAAMLESLRVLHAGPPLRNDILFLFTDGEELGWHGAQAYIAAHPRGKDETGVLLIFDARPGNAPLCLAETSPGDGWLVRQMAGLPLPLWAGAWKNLQERQETDTDFDVFQPAGYTGMALENEASGRRYHTSRDTADAISPKLVQAYGQTMLELAGRFGSIDLRSRTEAPDLVFFTLSGAGLVAYPYELMLALSWLGMAAWAAFIIIAWRRGRLSLKRVLAGAAGLLLGTALITLGAQLAWGLVKASQTDTAGKGFEGSAVWQAGLVAAAAVLMIGLMARLSRFAGGSGAAVAAPVIFLLAGYAFNSVTKTDPPLATAWIAWSFLGGVAGLGALLFARRPAWKAALLAGAGWMAMALAIPRIWIGTYTREDAWLPVLVTCLWIGLLAPQVEAVFGKPEV